MPEACKVAASSVLQSRAVKSRLKHSPIEAKKYSVLAGWSLGPRDPAPPTACCQHSGKGAVHTRPGTGSLRSLLGCMPGALKDTCAAVWRTRLAIRMRQLAADQRMCATSSHKTQPRRNQMKGAGACCFAVWTGVPRKTAGLSYFLHVPALSTFPRRPGPIICEGAHLLTPQQLKSSPRAIRGR